MRTPNLFRFYFMIGLYCLLQSVCFNVSSVISAGSLRTGMLIPSDQVSLVDGVRLI